MEDLSGIIKRTEKDGVITLDIDLDKAKSLEQTLDLGIPVKNIGPPLAGEPLYYLLECWYREQMNENKTLLVYHKDFFKSLLGGALIFLKDSFEYLVTEGKERKKKGWRFPNEAVLIGDWVFPANALVMATLPEDFKFKQIKINLKRGKNHIVEVIYNNCGTQYNKIEYQAPR